jgi:3-deoxy-manno-octulosonate cytidylyltransferase (CMP-KDO synthetase)
MVFAGIIPARYASTRFPGKPLVEINGKSMIQRVYEQALKAGCLSHVVVATDDQRIFDHVSTFGKVVFTSPDHQSGTDRCYEAAAGMAKELNLSAEDVIVNIQGDEPYIHPEQIQSVCDMFISPGVNIATLLKRIESEDQIFNENVVKVVTAENGKALYFSRSAIPYYRNLPKNEWSRSGNFFRHIGMYAYRFGTLGQLTKLPLSGLEKIESLEQLRWIENGFEIFVNETLYESHSVDTPDDLRYFSG